MNDIERSIVQQLVDLTYGKPEQLNKPITYAISDGIYCIKKTQFGYVTTKIDSVPYVDPIEEEIHIEFGKAKYELFLQAYSFFKDVCDKTGDEAALVLYYDKIENKYEWHCPYQTVSKASVKFDKDPVYLERQQDQSRYVKICEAHSHNTMDAFYSGTDNSDEKFEGFFMVFGYLDKQEPKVLPSFVGSGKRVITDLFDLFERPKVIFGNTSFDINTPIFCKIDYPQEWHTKLIKYEPERLKSNMASYKQKQSLIDLANKEYKEDEDDIYYTRLEQITDDILYFYENEIRKNYFKHYDDPDAFNDSVIEFINEYADINGFVLTNNEIQLILENIYSDIMFRSNYTRW